MTNSSVCGNGKGAGKRRRWLLGPTAAVMLSAVICGGCGNDVVDGGDYNPLVLRSGEAWALDYSGDRGVVFTADGRVFDIARRSGDTTWRSNGEGAYTLVSGTKVTITYPGNDLNGTWTIELSDGGNTLTVYRGNNNGYQSAMVFTRNTGVKFTPPPPPSTNPGTGGDLVLPAGQAWVDWSDEDYASGMVFESDSFFKMLSNTDGPWDVVGMGTYSMSDSNITLSIFGQVFSETYSVSGNTLTMTFNERATEFTKTSGVYPQLPPAGTGGELVLASGQAWVDWSDEDYGFGIVFESDGYFKMLRNTDGTWVVYREGTYLVNGGYITIVSGGIAFGGYSVSGNSLTLPGFNGEYTKTSGIVITNSPGNPAYNGMNKKFAPPTILKKASFSRAFAKTVNR